ncbi:MAG: hypothetical protein N3B21_09560 [Clostridia bacterium]|nr:hypothetical protein [Clostridia bacterium]
MKANVVKIDGSGKCYSDIAVEYMEYITNRDFNLTIDEACYYLSCSYTYFLINFRDIFKHIYINTPARIMINRTFNTEQGTNLNLSLIRKKVLYSKSDFEEFLKRNLKVEVMYKSFKLSDFSVLSDFHVLESLCSPAEVLNVLNLASKELYGVPLKPSVYDFKDFGYRLPQRLLGLNDLKSQLGFKHNTQLYRKMNSSGGIKYRLNNLVRFDVNDFASGSVLVNFTEYMKHGNDNILIMQNILAHSLNIKHK